MLSRRKDLKQKKLVVKGNFSNHMEIVNMGKFAIYTERGKWRENTDWAAAEDCAGSVVS